MEDLFVSSFFDSFGDGDGAFENTWCPTCVCATGRDARFRNMRRLTLRFTAIPAIGAASPPPEPPAAAALRLLSIVVVVAPIFLFFNDADSDTKEGGAGAACPMARCMNFKEEMRDDSGFVMGGTGPVVSGGVGGGITPNE